MVTDWREKKKRKIHNPTAYKPKSTDGRRLWCHQTSERIVLSSHRARSLIGNWRSGSKREIRIAPVNKCQSCIVPSKLIWDAVLVLYQTNRVVSEFMKSYESAATLCCGSDATVMFIEVHDLLRWAKKKRAVSRVFSKKSSKFTNQSCRGRL